MAVGIFDNDVGLIFSGSFDQLQIQLVGATACALWTMTFCYFFFSILSSINRFRVAAFYEIIGIDLLMHASIHDLSTQKFFSEREDRIKQEKEQKGDMWTDHRTYKQSMKIAPMEY